METGTDFFKTLNDINRKDELANYIFEKLGIENNPKKDELFSLAYEYGHSCGNEEIWSYACDFIDLIK